MLSHVTVWPAVRQTKRWGGKAERVHRPITSADKPSSVISSVLSWDFLDAFCMHIWLLVNAMLYECVFKTTGKPGVPVACENGERQDEISLLISHGAKYVSHRSKRVPSPQRRAETSRYARVCKLKTLCTSKFICRRHI